MADSKPDIQNRNKGTSGNNKTNSQAEGNRGKQKNPNQQNTSKKKGEKKGK